MKRLLALLLALVMLVTFTACGNKTADTDKGGDTTTSATDGTTSTTEGTTTTTEGETTTTVGSDTTTNADGTTTATKKPVNYPR